MLEELKEIIALKAEKQIAEINFRRYSKRLEKEEAKRKSKKGLALQPRGGAPSARFVLPQEPPKLEFGFRPLTTQTVVTTTTPATTKFHFDDNDQVLFFIPNIKFLNWILMAQREINVSKETCNILKLEFFTVAAKCTKTTRISGLGS